MIPAIRLDAGGGASCPANSAREPLTPVGVAVAGGAVSVGCDGADGAAVCPAFAVGMVAVLLAVDCVTAMVPVAMGVCAAELGVSDVLADVAAVVGGAASVGGDVGVDASVDGVCAAVLGGVPVVGVPVVVSVAPVADVPLGACPAMALSNAGDADGCKGNGAA